MRCIEVACLKVEGATKILMRAGGPMELLWRKL